MLVRIACGAATFFMSLFALLVVASMIVALQEDKMDDFIGAAFFAMVLLSALVATFLVTIGRSDVLGQIRNGMSVVAMTVMIAAIPALVVAAVVALFYRAWGIAAASVFCATWIALFIFVKKGYSPNGGGGEGSE